MYNEPLLPSTIEWLRGYCNRVPSPIPVTLPAALIQDLALVKRKEKVKGYMVISFEIDDMALFHDILTKVNKEDETLTIISINPVTIKVTREKLPDVGFLLELEVEEKDVLVDFTLLENNNSLPDELYAEYKDEVLLLPGAYTFKMLNYQQLKELTTLSY